MCMQVFLGSGRTTFINIFTKNLTKFTKVLTLQLDCTSCADTQKINLLRDREGYYRFECTVKKLSTRRINWRGVKIYIFFFGDLFLKNR